jgi:hypothetical protein
MNERDQKMCDAESQTYQTPLEDLRRDALRHYDDAASKVHHWSSSIPQAINFYYDYRQMSIWQKIKLILKQK